MVLVRPLLMSATSFAASLEVANGTQSSASRPILTLKGFNPF
jgi:hypothetical protein